MFYITGDTHGNFDRIEKFCQTNQTTKDDVLIILGDVGLNFYGGTRDEYRKSYVQSLPITIFGIHGNHEIRPETIKTYETKIWNEGVVYYEPNFPNILFAKDGEIFNFDGEQVLVIGGAYSVDKYYRLAHHYSWWPDEQPSEDTKKIVEQCCEINDWKIDVVLSHTTPLKYVPTECFLPGVDQTTVDTSTEVWLDSIEDRLNYYKWYCGHYHTEKNIDNIELMFNSIHEF